MFAFIALFLKSSKYLVFLVKIVKKKTWSLAMKTFLCIFFFFSCKQTQNMLSFAECDFSTEKLLARLANTAKWDAINLAHSMTAACLFCKGKWAHIKLEYEFRAFQLMNARDTVLMHSRLTHYHPILQSL